MHARSKLAAEQERVYAASLSVMEEKSKAAQRERDRVNSECGARQRALDHDAALAVCTI